MHRWLPLRTSYIARYNYGDGDGSSATSSLYAPFSFFDPSFSLSSSSFARRQKWNETVEIFTGSQRFLIHGMRIFLLIFMSAITHHRLPLHSPLSGRWRSMKHAWLSGAKFLPGFSCVLERRLAIPVRRLFSPVKHRTAIITSPFIVRCNIFITRATHVAHARLAHS